MATTTTTDDPLRIISIFWRITAEDADMRAAEQAVIGPYIGADGTRQHMSDAAYTPMDEDDIPPEPEERVIDLYPKNEAHRALFPIFFAIAAHLGTRCTVGVVVQTPAVSAHFDTENSNFQYLRVHESVLLADMHQRILRAKRVLDGADRESDR